VETDHQHTTASSQLPWRARLVSVQAWSDVAHNFRNDLLMLWREMVIGFLLAGMMAQLSDHFFASLFIHRAPAGPRTVENVLAGAIVAMLSFVCSVGNVPLAAVLWSGGISFAGVLAFIFADLLVLPILSAYRRYYGAGYAARISALMFVAIVVAALLVSGAANLLHLMPHVRPSRTTLFPAVRLNVDLGLNVAALAIFAAFIALTVRRGESCPGCGMRVDRSRAVTEDQSGRTLFFCSAHCREHYAHARTSAGGRPA
jgi:hypothetical protein